MPSSLSRLLPRGTGKKDRKGRLTIARVNQALTNAGHGEFLVATRTTIRFEGGTSDRWLMTDSQVEFVDQFSLEQWLQLHELLAATHDAR